MSASSRPEPRPDWTPDQARRGFRAGVATPTAGYCAGYAQANLIAVPRDLAGDVALFAARNPKPCPVLDVGEPGQVSTALFPGDLRTDLPRYAVYERGELVATPTDVSDLWRPDLVAFLIGCSFTFESALLAEGIEVRHQSLGCNVPMYRTSRPTIAAGDVAGPLVVSMRPVAVDQVGRVEQITGRYPAVHGAPVHIGDPAALGIADLDSPDYGDPVPLHPGELPVFWACGVTPQLAVAHARPDLAIGHAPGCMAITDAKDVDYRVS